MHKRQPVLQMVEHAYPLGPCPPAEGSEQCFVASKGVMWKRNGVTDLTSSQEYAHTEPQCASEVSRGQAELQLTLWLCRCQHFDYTGAVMDTGVVSIPTLGASQRKPASSSQRHHQLLSRVGSHPLHPASAACKKAD